MGIGDEVMLTGEVRVRPHKRFAILSRFDVHRYHEVWENHPRIAKPGEQYDETLKICGHHRPYIESYDCERYRWREYQPPRGEFFFSKDEARYGKQYAGRVIFGPHKKPGAPEGKDWGWVRWSKLAWIVQRKGVRVTQLGFGGNPLLLEAEFMNTPRFRLAAALIANARAVVTHEGALHHAAAVFGTPCIVIRGGFIGKAVTGYEGQIDFGEEGLGCGNRTPCFHCFECMNKIKPEAVADRLMSLL